MRFRDLKRQARQDIHNALSEPAWFLSAPGATPVPVTVRLQLRQDTMGANPNGENGYAVRNDEDPKIIFWSAQASPEHNSIVVFKDMGAWRVSADAVPYDSTIEATVIRLTDRQVTDEGWTPNALWLGMSAPVI